MVAVKETNDFIEQRVTEIAVRRAAGCSSPEGGRAHRPPRDGGGTPPGARGGEKTSASPSSHGEALTGTSSNDKEEERHRLAHEVTMERRHFAHQPAANGGKAGPASPPDVDLE